MTEEEKWERITNIYNAAAYKAMSHTPQLYIWTDSEKDKFEPLGSSIVFTVQGRYYLITAGHCLKQNNEDIKIGVINEKGHLTLIKGAVAVWHGEDKKIDLGIVKLSDHSIDMLIQQYSFLTETNVIFNLGIKDETEYFIFGYPLTKTQINYRSKRIQIEPFVYLAQSKPIEVYNQLSYKKEENIILGFNQRKSQFMDIKEMNMSPEPKGISGGGLWYIHSYEVEDMTAVPYSLAGIMIEHDRKKNVMIATKTEMFVPLMHELEKFDANTGLLIAK